MKRGISALVAGAMLISLCGCGIGDDVADKIADGINSAVNEAVSEAAEELAPVIGTGETSAPVSDSAISGESGTSDTELPDTEPSDTDVLWGSCEDYVNIETADTGYGRISYPVFLSDKLDGDDVKAANSFFEAVRDSIIENAESYKNGGDYNGEFSDLTMMIGNVECAVNAGVVSVMMSYSVYNAMGAFPYYKAVSFDIETGKALDPREVVKKALYDETMVEESIRFFAEECLSANGFFNVFYDKYISGGVPSREELLPSYMEADIAVAIDSYKNGRDVFPDMESKGTAWENLPTSPTVYLDERGQLYVGASVPVSAGGEVINSMIAVGRDSTQISVLNRKNPYNALSGVKPLSAEGAIDGALMLVPMDLPDVTTAVQGIDYIPVDPDDIYSGSDFAYVVNVMSEGETVGVFGVGAFYENMWEYRDGGWQPLPKGSPTVEISRAYYENAMGIIFCNPNEYETWTVSPVAEAWVTDISGYFLVTVMSDDTTVTLLSGSQDADGVFNKDEVLFQATVGVGDWIKVYAPVEESGATLAVEFATGADMGICMVQATKEELEDNYRMIFARGSEA